MLERHITWRFGLPVMLSPLSASYNDCGTLARKKCAERETNCQHATQMVEQISFRRGATMFWNLFRLQPLLDSLFDDGWVSMGLPERLGCDENAVRALLHDAQTAPILSTS